MYTDNAYYKNVRGVQKDKKHPLFVESCGTYHLYTRPILPTYRPRGRTDFQLIYISSGCGHFIFDGTEQIVPAGNMVLYRPREVQRYFYYGEDHTEVFWVHFTGNNVTNILREFGFVSKNQHVYKVGTSLEYKNIFQEMIHELKGCQQDYEEMLICHLKTLFILVHRVIGGYSKPQKTYISNEMNEAVKFFDSNYNKKISIQEYASKHGMSTSWFIRNFKLFTEETPAQYIISLRILNAQHLLKETDNNITEVANIVGYDNPLYFSRIFKEKMGVSPKEYRKQV